MTEAVKPSVFGSAITGWREGLSALASMPVVAGAAFVVMVAVGAASLPLLPEPDGTQALWAQPLTYVVGIVQSFLLTPVAIAVHRYVLLGEITQRYALNPFDPRFVRFLVLPSRSA